MPPALFSQPLERGAGVVEKRPTVPGVDVVSTCEPGKLAGALGSEADAGIGASEKCLHGLPSCIGRVEMAVRDIRRVPREAVAECIAEGICMDGVAVLVLVENVNKTTASHAGPEGQSPVEVPQDGAHAATVLGMIGR